MQYLLTVKYFKIETDTELLTTVLFITDAVK